LGQMLAQSIAQTNFLMGELAKRSGIEMVSPLGSGVSVGPVAAPVVDQPAPSVSVDEPNEEIPAAFDDAAHPEQAPLEAAVLDAAPDTAVEAPAETKKENGKAKPKLIK
jgi:hypothetical protein